MLGWWDGNNTLVLNCNQWCFPTQNPSNWMGSDHGGILLLMVIREMICKTSNTSKFSKVGMNRRFLWSIIALVHCNTDMKVLTPPGPHQTSTKTYLLNLRGGGVKDNPGTWIYIGRLEKSIQRKHWFFKKNNKLQVFSRMCLPGRLFWRCIWQMASCSLSKITLFRGRDRDLTEGDLIPVLA